MKNKSDTNSISFIGCFLIQFSNPVREAISGLPLVATHSEAVICSTVRERCLGTYFKISTHFSLFFCPSSHLKFRLD